MTDLSCNHPGCINPATHYFDVDVFCREHAIEAKLKRIKEAERKYQAALADIEREFENSEIPEE